MLILIVVILMVAIAAYEVPIMIRLKEWGELKLFAVLWSTGLTLAVLQTGGFPIPSPTGLVIRIMPQIVRAVGRLLGLIPE